MGGIGLFELLFICGAIFALLLVGGVTFAVLLTMAASRRSRDERPQ